MNLEQGETNETAARNSSRCPKDDCENLCSRDLKKAKQLPSSLRVPCVLDLEPEPSL